MINQGANAHFVPGFGVELERFISQSLISRYPQSNQKGDQPTWGVAESQGTGLITAGAVTELGWACGGGGGIEGSQRL